MSNDEQAWYTAAEAEAPVRFRVGTVVPEPFQEAEAATPLRPFERAEPATPVQPFEHAESARIAPEAFQRDATVMPVQPFERAQSDRIAPEAFQRDAAVTPVEPFDGELTPRIVDRGLRQGQPVSAAEPLHRQSVAAPAEQATAPTAAHRTDAMAGNRISARPAATNRDASGNAGQGFQVDPAQYQAAVSPMLAVSEQVGSLYSALSSYLPALESQNPWGNDESGKQFAEGDKGYLKYSKDTLDVIKGLPAALKAIADGLKSMADGYQGADEGVITELNGVDPGTAPMPASPQLSNPVPMRITPRISQSGRH
ncbi:hypothetical protein [Kitasatospora griseola]|uniref:hypothetical protein n=1 Tax=Kitasatospora griseola TaxID=2064 RepID=UPI00380792A2